MKCILIATCITFMLMNCVTFVHSDDDAWKEFKTNFDKVYATPEEEQIRMKIFMDNKLYVETRTQASFTQGINSLSDLTTEEINASRNGFRLGPDDERPIEGMLEALLQALHDTVRSDGPEVMDKEWYDNIISPPRLDWRARGRVSKVKDQGSCGSCWSFATTGALESILATRNRSVLLSEQNLVDCSRSYGNYGCNGGLMDAALRYVRDRGIMASKDYPYTGKDERCKFQSEKSVTSVRGSAVLPRGNEALLRLVLSIMGPIPIAIDASARSFHSYKSGVYDDRTCRNSNRALNHAVLLVGYGSESAGGDYWIVKNSWGDKWGDNGYIKMARNRDNLCGVATFAVLPLP